jgi:hypothetical protein
MDNDNAFNEKIREVVTSIIDGCQNGTLPYGIHMRDFIDNKSITIAAQRLHTEEEPKKKMFVLTICIGNKNIISIPGKYNASISYELKNNRLTDADITNIVEKSIAGLMANRLVNS